MGRRRRPSCKRLIRKRWLVTSSSSRSTLIEYRFNASELLLALPASVSDEDGHSHLLPRVGQRVNLSNAALESVAVTEAHQQADVAIQLTRNVAQTHVLVHDGNSLGIIGVVRLCHQLQLLAGLQLAEHHSAPVMLKSRDVEGLQVST